MFCSFQCAACITIYPRHPCGHACIRLQHCAYTKVEPLATLLRVSAVCPLIITTDSIS